MIMPVDTSESKSPMMRKSGEVPYSLSINLPAIANRTSGTAIAIPTSNANAVSSARVVGAVLLYAPSVSCSTFLGSSTGGSIGQKAFRCNYFCAIMRNYEAYE